MQVTEERKLVLVAGDGLSVEDLEREVAGTLLVNVNEALRALAGSTSPLLPFLAIFAQECALWAGETALRSGVG